MTLIQGPEHGKHRFGPTELLLVILPGVVIGRDLWMGFKVAREMETSGESEVFGDGLSGYSADPKHQGGNKTRPVLATSAVDEHGKRVRGCQSAQCVAYLRLPLVQNDGVVPPHSLDIS